jgi:hypothetical protein
MSLEPAGSAAVNVSERTAALRYDLRWYRSSDFVVPVWWLGVTDPETDQLDRTEVFRGTDDVGPNELLRWLTTVVGDAVARRLAASAVQAVTSLSAVSSA